MKIKMGLPSRMTIVALDAMIAYRPRLNTIIDSVVSTLILCQSMYYAEHTSNPFYKFLAPCEHEKYKRGDSWMEELALSRYEVMAGLKRIAQKVSNKTQQFDPDVYMWYWTDMSRLTWFCVNWNAVNKAFELQFPVSQETLLTKVKKLDLRKSKNLTYVSQETELTIYKDKSKNLSENLSKKSSSSDSGNGIQEGDGIQSDPVKADDDDFLLKDLIDLGLSPSVAKEVLSKYPRELVLSKVKEIMRMFQRGAINNLIGYVSRTFSQALYSPKQAEAILNAHKAPVIPGLEEEESSCDIDISGINEEIRELYLKRVNATMMSLYKKRGWDSPVLCAGLSQYYRDMNDKGSSL